MAKNKFNQSWLHDHINDPYVKLAQREGYRARAAYKLKEIDEQDKLIKPGQVIVDLGAAPGSWSQYVRNKLAASPRAKDGRIDGAIVAIDILPMEPIADVTFIQGISARRTSSSSSKRSSWMPQAVAKWTLFCRIWPPISQAWRRRTPRAWSTLPNWLSNLPWHT